MAGQAPKPRYVSFPCSGVLNQIATPAAVGGSGLTAAMNLIYHRQGSWGKRTGATRVALPPAGQQTPVSGFRWYRAWPNPTTKLVVYANNHLYIGNDQFSLTDKGAFPLSGSTAPMFCSARNPQARQGQGSDTLIITGMTLPAGSFATGTIKISGLPGPQPSGVYMTLTVTQGANSVTTPKYYVLGTDNAASIASQLVILLNETAAYLNQLSSAGFAPFIDESFYTYNTPPIGALNTSGHGQSGVSPPTATIYLGARNGGGGGNNITYAITLSSATGGDGTPLTISAGANSGITSGTSTATMSGGGNQWSGPAKYEPETDTIAGLSYMAPNAWSGCVSWHDHVWLWGDRGNPDYVFACDIFQPQAFTFMIQNGPTTGPYVGTMSGPQNGGYPIGPGDGDPQVQNCVPLGNALYVFKTSNIYMIEGYDFQPGEYQFSVTPQVAGYGIPSPECVDVLENEVVFWSGRKLLRLAVGAYEPEHIGLPVPFLEGLMSSGNQSLVRCVAGDFQVQAALTNNFGIPQPYADSTIIYRSLAMWAFDSGSGVADTIAVYDDEATQERQQYAWSIWSGWKVGAWVQYGSGPNASGNNTDKPAVFFIDPPGNYYHFVGNNATSDWGNPIAWLAQTGVIEFASAEILKNAHRLFLNAEAQPGAVFATTFVPGRIVPANNQVMPYSTTPVTFTASQTQGPTGGEAMNCLEVPIEPSVQAKSILVQINESGSALKGFEMLSIGLDLNPEEAFQP